MIDDDTAVKIVGFISCYLGVIAVYGFSERGALLMIGLTCIAYYAFTQTPPQEVQHD